MTHYVAIIEDEGPRTAVGVWFPDLPGCFSAGDTVDQAIRNAGQAIAAYAEALTEDGRSLPSARSIGELRRDDQFVADSREHLLALIPGPEMAAA